MCDRCGLTVPLSTQRNECGAAGECHQSTGGYFVFLDPGMLCCDYCTVEHNPCRRRAGRKLRSCTPSNPWTCQAYEPNRQPAPSSPDDPLGLKCVPCDRTARPACAEFETERLSPDQPMCACRVCDEWMPPLCAPP